MKTKIFYCCLVGIATLIGFAAGKFIPSYTAPTPTATPVPTPLAKYTIENLSNTQIYKSEIKIGEVLKEDKNFTSYLFTQEINPNLDGKTMKNLTGMINIPKGDVPFPLIFMNRGYVDPEIYSTGVGTRRSAEEYAKAGFITVAPDFLGYAGSDGNAADILESRFQTYTTALSTLFSIDSISSWDKQNVFIWGHSNGGQIALTLLEVTGAEFPTVLWAPVSKPFPYSVLYYTDESQDKGKFLRYEISKFEGIYDSDKFSIDEYFDRIKAPIQLHQGTADDAVPLAWSELLAKKLDLSCKAGPCSTGDYYTYPGSDHNLSPAWDSVVARDIQFFKNHLK